MFALMDAYLRSLPNGLDSYPQAQSKPGGTIELLHLWPELKALAPHLPPPLTKLVQTPPPASVWIPEVHAESLLLVAYEVRCRSDDSTYLELINAIGVNQLRLPAYRLLFRALGARLSVRVVAAAWSNFHRGSQLVVTSQSGGDIMVELRFPPELLHKANLSGFGQSFLVALNIGGVTNPSVQLVDSSSTHARFRCTT